MSVIAYVSGHGFGHAAREIEILRHLPPDIRLVVKSSSPEWFWREEMHRPFDFVGDSFDVGCVQRDSLHIDVPATLAAARAMATENRRRVGSERAYLAGIGARIVVSDVASFPLAVAADAGIANVCIANFTWADIYAAFVEEEPKFAEIVEEMLSQYHRADTCLDTDLALPMPYWRRRESVGLVARPGVRRREELDLLLPPAASGKKVALLYVGNWGYAVDYARLERYADWQFVSYETPPYPPTNWTVLRRAHDWPHPDLVASVDLVISKPGYGITAECLSTGTPLLYPPRPEFAEYTALHAALSEWPGGIFIDRERFESLDWVDGLLEATRVGRSPALSAPGGPAAAARIVAAYRATE